MQRTRSCTLTTLKARRANIMHPGTRRRSRAVRTIDDSCINSEMQQRKARPAALCAIRHERQRRLLTTEDTSILSAENGWDANALSIRCAFGDMVFQVPRWSK